MLGCGFAGAHLHVVRRENPNQASAKSRRSRVVPADWLTIQAHDQYVAERAFIDPDHRSDFVGQARVINWHRQFIDQIADKLRDDAVQPFPPAVVVPYCCRHSYAQRHADSGAAPDVLRDLMGHRTMQTTMGYYRITEVRVRRAVEQVALQQFDGQGRRVFHQINDLPAEEHSRLRVGQVAVPFGICTEPTNVKAGGHACPYKFTCVGCGHFRSDASYLPELKSYLQQLLADRERIMAATDLQDWAKAKTAPATEKSPNSATSSTASHGAPFRVRTRGVGSETTCRASRTTSMAYARSGLGAPRDHAALQEQIRPSKQRSTGCGALSLSAARSSTLPDRRTASS